jgi:hypothetical protein
MENNTILEHLAEEVLERFVLQQSCESEIETVETHFLACENCVERLEQVELYISATKLALQQLHTEQVARSVAKRKARGFAWFSVPRLSIVGSFAMVIIALSVAPRVYREKNPAVNVELTTYRGLESPVLPKDRNLHVRLNAKGLDGTLTVVKLVNGDGFELWKQQAAIRDNIVTIEVPQIHSTGDYLFRLYAPGNSAESVREFSVDVE